jgi:hypothetical protein
VPYEVRLASPRLYPIRPRPARRYGDAGAPFAFGVGASFVFRDDVGYELFTERSRSGALDLFGSYDIWAPTAAIVMAAGLNFRSELHDGADNFSIAHNSLQAELNARFVAARWLAPHLRIAAGFVATRFSANDPQNGLDYEDVDRGFAGSLGAGFTLRTPARLFETYGGRLSSLAFGVLFEGGYTMANAASLRAKPTSRSEIERATFSVGELERGGPYFRVLAVIRF